MRFHYLYDSKKDLRVTIASRDAGDEVVAYGVTVTSEVDIEDHNRKSFRNPTTYEVRTASTKEKRQRGKSVASGRCTNAVDHTIEWGQERRSAAKNAAYRFTVERFKKLGVMSLEEFKNNLRNLRQVIEHLGQGETVEV